jgi:hypothetical protein
MRKLFLSLAAAGAIAVCPVPAGAMTAGDAPGFKAAAAEIGATIRIVYICKQRYWSGKRYCYWRPGGYRWRWHWRRPRWFR